MRTLLNLLLLLVWFALHKKPVPGPPPGKGTGKPGRPPQQHGSVDAGAGLTSAQKATRDLEQEARPSGPTSDRDIHGKLRETEREVDVDRVRKEGKLLYQADGQLVRVLSNGDGTYSVVITDPSNPSGNPTTTIPDITEKQLQSRLDREYWNDYS